MDSGFDSIWVQTLEPAEVYKQDRRSKVWRIDAPPGRAYVVKRFTYNPVKQRLAKLIHIHPGQREQRRCRQLMEDGVAVVPIVGQGASKRGAGLELWLATPYLGKSLYNLFFHKELESGERRANILNAVGRLTGGLIDRRLFNRDHKASNILIDEEDKPWLIDVGGVRRSRGASDTTRMIQNLRVNLAEAGADADDLASLDQAPGSNGPVG